MNNIVLRRLDRASRLARVATELTHILARESVWATTTEDFGAIADLRIRVCRLWARVHCARAALARALEYRAEARWVAGGERGDRKSVV